MKYLGNKKWLILIIPFLFLIIISAINIYSEESRPIDNSAGLLIEDRPSNDYILKHNYNPTLFLVVLILFFVCAVIYIIINWNKRKRSLIPNMVGYLFISFVIWMVVKFIFTPFN